MNQKDYFYQELKTAFIPELRSLGFKGSGQHYRRILGDVIHAINIQNNRHGGSCCVNLGIHLSFLPLAISPNSLPEPKKIKEIDCQFRWRLAPKGQSDYWWHFDGRCFQGQVSNSIEFMKELYLSQGETKFNKYQTVDDLLVTLSSNDVYTFPHLTAVRRELTLARIHTYLGNDELAKKHAQLGLAHIDRNKPTATVAELKRLANEA